MCPHTAIYMSAYCYICVRILLYTCPHTAIYMSAYSVVPSPRAEFFKIPFDCDGGCDVGMRSAVVLSGKLGTRSRSKLGTTLSGFDCDGGCDVGQVPTTDTQLLLPPTRFLRLILSCYCLLLILRYSGSIKALLRAY